MLARILIAGAAVAAALFTARAVKKSKEDSTSISSELIKPITYVIGTVRKNPVAATLVIMAYTLKNLKVSIHMSPEVSRILTNPVGATVVLGVTLLISMTAVYIHREIRRV